MNHYSKSIYICAFAFTFLQIQMYIYTHTRTYNLKTFLYNAMHTHERIHTRSIK